MQNQRQQVRPWGEVTSSEQFQALSPEHQERARELYYQDNVAPRVPQGMEQRAREMFDQDTAASSAMGMQIPDRQGGIEVMDYAKEAGAGVLTGTGAMISGAGDLVRPNPQERAPVETPNGEFTPLSARIGSLTDPVTNAIANAIDAPARAVGEWLSGKGKAISDSKTDAAKEALKASTPTGDIDSPSTWSMGEDPSVAGYGLHLANLAGQFGPQAGAMIATKGRSIQTPAMMGLGGLQAGGSAGDEVEQRITETLDADLQASSGLYQKLRQTMPEQEARKSLIETARSAAFDGAAPVGALGGLATQVALGPLQRSIGGSVGRKLAAGTLIEAPVEGALEVAETTEARRSTNKSIEEDRSLTEGTFGDFALGALGGTGFSVAGTALSGKDASSQASADEVSQEPESTFENTPAPLAIEGPGLQGLPQPGQVFYGDSQGGMQDIGPIKSVDGVMQPTPQSQQWVNPNNRTDAQASLIGGEGMEAQTPRGAPAGLQGQFIPSQEQQSMTPPAKMGLILDGNIERLGLPEPEAFVVDSEGNTQRGATAPQVFNEPPMKGGAGMDQQAPTAPPKQQKSAPKAMPDEKSPQERAQYSWDSMNTFERNAAAANVLGMRGVPAKNAATKAWDKLSSEQQAKLVTGLESQQGKRWTDPNQRVADQSGPVLQNRDRTSGKALEQMRDISNKPDYMRLGYSRDFGNGAPVIEEGLKLPASQLGKQEQMTTSQGRRIPAQYAVIESDQLLPSNQSDGTVNTTYATGEEGKSRAIAGNGRVAGLQAAWRKGNADTYKTDMIEDAGAHGIDGAVIQKMKQPVLVRVMPRSEITQNIGDESNRSGQLDLNKLEQAKTDMRRLNLLDLKYGANGQITPETVMQFIQSMPSNENLMIDGEISSEATDRLETAVFHKAYDNDKLTVMQSQKDDESKSIIAALLQAAPHMIKLEGAGEVYDIRPLIIEAAMSAINARRRGIRLSEYVKQAEMGISPEAYPIMEMMLNDKGAIRSGKYIGEQFINMVDTAFNEAGKPSTDMYGDVPKRTQEQTIKDSLTEVEGHGQLNATGSEKTMGQQGGPESTAQVDEWQSGRPGRPTDTEQAAPAQPEAKPETAEARLKKKAAEKKASTEPTTEKWRKNYLLAKKRATELGLDPKEHGKLPGLVKAIDAAIAEKAKPEAPALDLAQQTEETLAAEAERLEQLQKEEATQKAKQKAAESKARERDADKARADEVVDDFQLGQPAEEVMSGMGDIFATESKSADKGIAAQDNDSQVTVVDDQYNPNPTEAQKQAGNYKKAHVKFQGIDITIENPVGSERSGVDPDGNTWSNTIKHDYGYIKRTTGADGDHVDVFIGKDTDSDKVFVIDQPHKNGKFDEHKVMLGFKGRTQAVAAYKGNYQKGWKVGPITEMTVGEFKQWLSNGDTTKPVETVAKPAAEQTKPNQAVEDYGEKMAGAIKDQPKTSLSENLTDEDIASQALSKIWPAKEVMESDDDFIAAFAYAARSRIPAKPRVRYKIDRWVRTVQGSRRFAQAAATGRITIESLNRAATRAESGLEEYANQVKLLMQIDRKDWGRIGDIHDYSKAYRFDDEGNKQPSPHISVNIDGVITKIDGATTIEETFSKVKNVISKDSKAASKNDPRQFEIRTVRSTGEIFINRKGDKEYRELKSFKKGELAAARDFVRNNTDDLAAAWEAVKERDNVSKADVRGDTNAERAGKDYRNGKDVTSEEFGETFGFRGVEFGNWVSQGKGQADRQGMLNAAYDALLDLASIVGVPPKAISLNGSLGIAFGSRGKGKASAHYETDNIVINLTKTKGAGSLAHEWFHALDNYFSRSRGVTPFDGNNAAYNKANYITYKPEPMMALKTSLNKKGLRPHLITKAEYDRRVERGVNFDADNWTPDTNHPIGVRPTVEKAFAELVSELDKSPMLARAEKIDKGKVDGYWSSIIERAARSFESYVIQRLEDQGISNQYLANVVALENFKRDEGRYPYLTNEELKPVAEKFDTLFSTIESRETDSGVQLYKTGSKNNAAGIKAEAITDALASTPELAGVKVVQSFEDLPERARKQAEIDGVNPGDLNGIYVNGTSYVVADNHATVTEAVRTAVHEEVGHLGIRGLLGDKLTPTMERIYSSMAATASGRKLIKDIRADYGHLRDKDQRQAVAEELIAHLIETGDKPTLVQRFVSKVRELLRAMFPQVKWTDSDVLALGEYSRKWLRTKNGENVPGMRYSLKEDSQQRNSDLFDDNDGYKREARPVQGRLDTDTQQDGSSIDLPDETAFRKHQRRWQDKLNRFTVIREWLADRGVELGENADVYLAEERMHSRFTNKTTDFREGTVKPLVEKIQKAGYTMEDVSQFLHAQHAQERNAQIAKINRNMPDGGSGMKNAEARAILAAADQKLVRVANELRAITDSTRKVLIDSGLISQEQADAWQKAYQYYVPLKGGPDDKASKAGTGKGLKAEHKAKRALGHDVREEGEWIIENILADHERALLSAEKNTVGKHLLKMAMDIGIDSIMTVGKPEKRGVLRNQVSYEVLYKGRPVGAFDTLEGAKVFKMSAPLTIGKAASPTDITIRKTSDPSVVYMASPMPALNEAMVYIKGDIIRVQINDELLARAYGNMGADALGTLFRSAQALNRWFSSVYTGYSPEFLIINVLRDFTTGLANITGEEGALFATKAVKNYFSSFGALLKYAYKGTDNKWIRMYREDGGNTGAAYLSDLERLGNDVQTEYAVYQGVIANLRKGEVTLAARAAGRKAFNVTLRYMEALNEAGENSMRLALYRTAVEQGMSRNRAASLSKNTTVNFNRKGEMTPQLNALYLFFNATVQGTASISHAHFKGKHKKQAWALSGAMAALSYSLSLLSAGSDEEEYEKTSEYAKERNIVIPLGNGEAVTIPVPYGYGFFFTFGRLMADIQRTGDTDGAAWKLASAFTGEFLPFGGTMAGDEPDMVQAGTYMWPTIAQIPLSVANNRTSFGSPMRPENSNKKFEPDRLKMWRGTEGTWADKLAGALESVGADVSPETLKHMSRTFGGGAGTFTGSVVDAIALGAQGAKPEIREIPIVRKFYRVNSVSDARSRFWRYQGETRKATEEFQRVIDSGDRGAVQEFVQSNRELIALGDVAKAFSEAASATRDRVQEIRLGDLPVAKKREQIKKLEEKEAELYDRFVRIFKDKKG